MWDQTSTWRIHWCSLVLTQKKNPCRPFQPIVKHAVFPKKNIQILRSHTPWYKNWLPNTPEIHHGVTWSLIECIDIKMHICMYNPIYILLHITLLGWTYLAPRHPVSHSCLPDRTEGENKMKKLMGGDKNRVITCHLLSQAKHIWPGESYFNLQ